MLLIMIGFLVSLKQVKTPDTDIKKGLSTKQIVSIFPKDVFSFLLYFNVTRIVILFIVQTLNRP